MARKAQGLSLNVIIIAAIALLVLVILAIIFIGRMGTTRAGVDQCQGTCVESVEACNEMGTYYKVTNDPCYKAGTTQIDEDRPICCLGV